MVHKTTLLRVHLLFESVLVAGLIGFRKEKKRKDYANKATPVCVN